MRKLLSQFFLFLSLSVRFSPLIFGNELKENAFWKDNAFLIPSAYTDMNFSYLNASQTDITLSEFPNMQSLPAFGLGIFKVFDLYRISDVDSIIDGYWRSNVPSCSLRNIKWGRTKTCLTAVSNRRSDREIDRKKNDCWTKNENVKDKSPEVETLLLNK